MRQFRSGRPAVLRSVSAGPALVLLASTLAWAVAGGAAWSFLADDDGEVEWVAAGKTAGIVTDGDQVYANDLKTGMRLWKKSPMFDAGNVDGLAAKAKVAYVLGSDYSSGESALRVSAIEEPTGIEYWSGTVRDGDSIDEYGEAVTVVGKTLVVAGTRYDGGSFPIVDAWDTKTGSHLWSFTGEGSAELRAIAGKGKVVAVAGQTQAFPYAGYLAILDAKTGNTIATLNQLEPGSDEGGFYGVAVSGKTVVAAGWQAANGAEPSGSSFVAAYDATDGSLLWKSVETTVEGRDAANDVIVLGKTAVVVGSRTVDPVEPIDPDQTEGYVRGFDLATGDQVWEVLREGGGDNDEVDDVVGKGKLAVVCGERVDVDGDYHNDTFGIDARSGDVLWTVADDPLESDHECDVIALSGKTVVFDSDGNPEIVRAATTK